MVLNLKVLCNTSTLNNLTDIGDVRIIKGTNETMWLQLYQADKKQRYIPTNTTVITIDFKNSDGSLVTKTATFPLADDRSVIQVVLTTTDTALLVSQTLVAKLVDGSDVAYAIRTAGFQVTSLTMGS